MRSGKSTALRGWTRCDKITASKTPGSRVSWLRNAAKEGEMTTLLLTTRLYVPVVQTDQAPRPRLIEWVSDAMSA